MKAEEKESAKSKSRLTIPAGGMVILPLRNRVLFPSMIMPVMIRRPERLQAVEETVRQQLPIGFVTQRDPNIDLPQPSDLYGVGTTADVLRMFTLPDGQRQILVQGRRRFEIGEFLQTDPVLMARVTLVEEQIPQTKEFAGANLTFASRSSQSLILISRAHERIEGHDRKD